MNRFVDQYLLFRVRSERDPDAFGRIYDRYVTSIYRFVYLKVPSREVAEDVTSETFLRCWQFIQSHAEVTHIRALLYRIARNLVADHYRRQDPPTVSTVTNEGVDTSSSNESDVSDGESGKRLIEARADLALVLTNVSRLKEDYQDVLLLRLIDGLSFGDIAKITEKSEGNVRVIFHRALKALDRLT